MDSNVSVNLPTIEEELRQKREILTDRMEKVTLFRILRADPTNVRKRPRTITPPSTATSGELQAESAGSAPDSGRSHRLLDPPPSSSTATHGSSHSSASQRTLEAHTQEYQPDTPTLAYLDINARALNDDQLIGSILHEAGDTLTKSTSLIDFTDTTSLNKDSIERAVTVSQEMFKSTTSVDSLKSRTEDKMIKLGSGHAGSVFLFRDLITKQLLTVKLVKIKLDGMAHNIMKSTGRRNKVEAAIKAWRKYNDELLSLASVNPSNCVVKLYHYWIQRILPFDTVWFPPMKLPGKHEAGSPLEGIDKIKLIPEGKDEAGQRSPTSLFTSSAANESDSQGVKPDNKGCDQKNTASTTENVYGVMVMQFLELTLAELCSTKLKSIKITPEMEYLYDKLKTHPRTHQQPTGSSPDLGHLLSMDPETRLDIFRCYLHGLADIHSMGLAHGDVDINNLFMTSAAGFPHTLWGEKQMEGLQGVIDEGKSRKLDGHIPNQYAEQLSSTLRSLKAGMKSLTWREARKKSKEIQVQRSDELVDAKLGIEVSPDEFLSGSSKDPMSLIIGDFGLSKRGPLPPVSKKVHLSANSSSDNTPTTATPINADTRTGGYMMEMGSSLKRRWKKVSGRPERADQLTSYTTIPRTSAIVSEPSTETALAQKQLTDVQDLYICILFGLSTNTVAGRDQFCIEDDAGDRIIDFKNLISRCFQCSDHRDENIRPKIARSSLANLGSGRSVSKRGSLRSFFSELTGTRTQVPPMGQYDANLKKIQELMNEKMTEFEIHIGHLVFGGNCGKESCKPLTSSELYGYLIDNRWGV